MSAGQSKVAGGQKGNERIERERELDRELKARGVLLSRDWRDVIQGETLGFQIDFKVLTALRVKACSGYRWIDPYLKPLRLRPDSTKHYILPSIRLQSLEIILGSVTSEHFTMRIRSLKSII